MNEKQNDGALSFLIRLILTRAHRAHNTNTNSPSCHALIKRDKENERNNNKKIRRNTDS